MSRHEKNVVGEVCIDSGWGEKTTFVIVAAQSVKNNVTDRSGSAVTNMLVDSGYTGQPFADAVQNVLGVTVEVANVCLVGNVSNLSIKH